MVNKPTSAGKKSKAALFLELAKPDGDGFSRRVSVDEFVDEYAELRLGNGGSWCRDDGGLANQFNVVRHKEKGKIVAIELHGSKKQPIRKPIPEHIRQALIGLRCVMLGTRGVEIDHKDGRRDDPRLSDASKVTLDDFQPLSKAANNAKRQHCKNCRDTGQRFDASQLGFPVAQFKGNGVYRGTCVGCFWHDPKRFRQEASKGNLNEDEA